MYRPRSAFVAISLFTALASQPATGTLAQAVCCAREDGCSVVEACPADDACPAGRSCSGGARETSSHAACDAGASSPLCAPCTPSAPRTTSASSTPGAPCVPDSERCPLLQNAPVEPVRNRVAAGPDDDVHVAALAPTAFIAAVPARITVAALESTRPRAVPLYRLLRRLLL